MTAIAREFVAVAALCGALFVATAVDADDADDATAKAPAADSSSPRDQVIVTARAITRLKLHIRLDEDAVYARFNAINSDDRFDIHCEMRARTGTRIEERFCQSNAAVADDTDYASASIAEVRRELGPVPEQFRAKKLEDEQLLNKEFRRLAEEDPALRESLIRLGQAYQALDVLNGGGQSMTLYREVTADEERLSPDAKHMFDVRIGPVPWTHPLTERTFAFASVLGRIRGLQVDCDHGKTSLKFQDDAEWTLPSAWGQCRLTVYAKHDTTFALVEFE